MRKSLLAMAALMGVATLPAHAWRVNIDKQAFADITFSTQVWGRSEGARTTTDHSATNFYVNLANIAASGQVNKLVYFNINAESPAFRSGFIVRDAFIGMRFADEFRVQVGAMRVPFSRIALTSSYNYLIPTQALSDVFTGLSINPIHAQGLLGDGSRDAGIVVWGNVAGGMLKYYLGISDGRFDRRGGFFTFTPPTAGFSPVNFTRDSLAYTIRLQITPTMLGFKPETGYTLSDTYLGRQNVLTLGVGYRVVGAETTVGPAVGGANARMFSYTNDAKMWTVDMLYEQKFGDIIPNLQVGYINARDVAYSVALTSANDVVVRYGRATQIYAQAQLLHDKVMGFGKPALAIRWEQDKNEDRRQFNTHTGATSSILGEPRNTRIGVFVNYYIKGQDAKVSFGVDSVNRNTDSRGANGRSFTDVTLHLQTRF